MVEKKSITDKLKEEDERNKPPIDDTTKFEMEKKTYIESTVSCIDCISPIQNEDTDTKDTIHTEDTEDTVDTDIIINYIDNKDKILDTIYKNSNITIKEISEKTNIIISTVKNSIHRNDGNNGLLDKGYIKLNSNNPNKYEISEKGKKYIDNLIKQKKDRLKEEKERINHFQQLKKELKDLKTTLKNNFDKLISDRILKGKEWVGFDFKEISKWNPHIADELLDDPEETIKKFNIAIESSYDKDMEVKFFNIPNQQKVRIGDVRIQHLNKFYSFDGVIKQTSQVKPLTTVLHLRCPACASEVSVIQNEHILKEPTRCGCGFKGKFDLIKKENIDLQIIKLEELPEELEGRTNCQSIKIMLKKTLAKSNLQKYYNPGSRIKINGIVKEIPIIKNNQKDVRSELIIEANYVEPQEETINLNITKEEQKQIKDLSKQSNIIEILLDTFLPQLININQMKLAVLLSLVKGGNAPRDEIHLLFAGEPGLAKSEILKKIPTYFPFCRYANGASSSNVGLTASVVKDEYTGSWGLNAGAVVMANNGVACIDEIDKMKDEDKNDLNECAEQGTVTVNKAGINGSLQAKTTLIMASNPKYHTFDSNSPFMQQLNLPYALLTRFDLIFILRNTNEEMLKLMELINTYDIQPTPKTIEKDLFVKYIISARELNPKMTSKAREIIMNKMRGIVEFKKTLDENLPLTVRQLHAMRRLSTAFAKLKFHQEVLPEDVNDAWDLYVISIKSSYVNTDNDFEDIK